VLRRILAAVGIESYRVYRLIIVAERLDADGLRARVDADDNTAVIDRHAGGCGDR